jgi:hypothetical protein
MTLMHCSLTWFLACLCLVGLVSAQAHGHTGCGHSLVAGESKRWSQLHRQHRQLVEQRTAAGLEDAAAPHLHAFSSRQYSDSTNSSDRHVQPRMLAAAGTVPIRVWVEYQGINSLADDGKQRLYDTVNIALGVLQKFLKVGWKLCMESGRCTHGGRCGSRSCCPFAPDAAAVNGACTDILCIHSVLSCWLTPNV